MNINILRYSLFGIARDQEVDRNFSYISYLPSYNDCIINLKMSDFFLELRSFELPLSICVFFTFNKIS